MSSLSDPENGVFGRSASDLREALAPYVGERVVALFSYAIADEAGALLPAVILRRILIDAGEDPDHPQVTEAEQLLIDWARQLARDPQSGDPLVTERLEAVFSPTLRGLLAEFAAQQVRANLHAAENPEPLDEQLYSYRKPGDERTA